MWAGCDGPVQVPLPKAADGRLALAVDVSPWLRPDADTAPERCVCHTYGYGYGAGHARLGLPLLPRRQGGRRGRRDHPRRPGVLGAAPRRAARLGASGSRQAAGSGHPCRRCPGSGDHDHQRSGRRRSDGAGRPQRGALVCDGPTTGPPGRLVRHIPCELMPPSSRMPLPTPPEDGAGIGTKPVTRQGRRGSACSPPPVPRPSGSGPRPGAARRPTPWAGRRRCRRGSPR